MDCGLIHINKEDLGSGCFSWNCIDSSHRELSGPHNPVYSSLSSSSFVSLHKPRTLINQSSQVLQEITQSAKGTEETAITIVTPKATVAPGPAVAAKCARFIGITEPMQKT